MPGLTADRADIEKTRQSTALTSTQVLADDQLTEHALWAVE